MSRFLGVDGGGTKTAFILIDDSGTVLAETRQPSCYYFSEGIGLVHRVLEAGIREVCAAAGIAPGDVDRSFFGIPSYGEVSGDVAELDAIPARVLGHDRYSVDNDMVCGFAGSLAGSDGVNVISGTGSMTYGERNGQGMRIGGWGELFGDEGSAYWVAVRGLNAYSRMSDGRAPRGALYDLVRERLDITTDLDAVDVVLGRWQSDRSAVADLARVVVRAADAGDPVATGILHDAVDELVLLVTTTVDTLGFAADETVPVSYSGGLFAADSVRDGFRTALGRAVPNAELRTPRLDPVAGAAISAAKQNTTPLRDAALTRLAQQR
ncbi:N-acetylglucosamine kinase [Curtobacterium sp. Leaf261]|uniref:N-acetylglucosamine kinase n=1 Tax=Curtobacterium sp. Leaf261 TaxID=1736311 RepID=UPI0006FED0FF|nr:BadF/BadG/BcrA/BcrD ATPase family protein [Curtobacterium sp. Leaf261]KQO63744.1 N-acetylglucosamine kinase [Curtobacterium sp. Leaf261]